MKAKISKQKQDSKSSKKNNESSKKNKKAVKRPTAEAIGKLYQELCQLRARVVEIEALRNGVSVTH